MGDTCATRCDLDGECLTGFFCDQNSCTAKRTMGNACTGDIQCASNHCIDGVCCQDDCSRFCHSCAVPGSRGTCTPIPDRADPEGECPPESGFACGRVGGCNGSGACRFQASGTGCGAAGVCSGVMETAGGACDGRGACTPGVPRDCRPYLCEAGACATSCTAMGACQAGFVCIAATCLVPAFQSLVVYDLANITGWSLQKDFQVGPGANAAHPWSDSASSYVSSIDAAASGLLGREWIRVSSASRAFAPGPQGSLGLQRVADVYLVVDDRWGPAPPWLPADWTDTGWNVEVLDSGTTVQAFSVFVRPAQNGFVDLPGIAAQTAFNYFVIVK
jgi:hypothetical protein